MIALGRDADHVGIERGNALPDRITHARMNDPVRPRSPLLPRERLRRTLIIGIEQRVEPSPAQIEQRRIQRPDQLPNLRQPPGIQPQRRIEPPRVML